MNVQVADTGEQFKVNGAVVVVGADGQPLAPGTGSGDASAANQAAVFANPGSDASKANAVQGVTGGKPVATTEKPDSTGTFAPLNASAVAYAASLIVKAAAGVLFNVTIHNSKNVAQFIQLHDSATLPSDAAVPVAIVEVPATSSYQWHFGGKFGRHFSSGIVICNSSTGPTKTIGSADCWFDAQYA